jgi:RNA polymerase sigma-70 factor, ECF subfamily
LGETTSYLRANPTWHTGYLVDKAKTGSETAWKALFQRYHRMLTAQMQARFYGVVRRRCDAEDVLQTAFAKAFENIGGFQYQGEGSFRRWLARLVMNAFADELRSHRAEQKASVEHDGDLQTMEDRAETERSAAEQRNQAMLEALNRMDEEDRSIVIERLFEKLSYREIAANLGVSRETARQLFAQALSRLSRVMGEE